MVLNEKVSAYFERVSAHSDVAAELVQAIKRLGDYEIRSGAGDFPALYCVTNEIIFCAAAGMAGTYWRLQPEDVEIALETGAKPTSLGPEWVEIQLFRADWPEPDIQHWALRAYDFARTGN